MKLTTFATLLLFSLVSARPNLGQRDNSSDSSSLTLVSSVIASNFAQDGLNATGSEPGSVASLTSTDNFINFCATLPNLPITNGQQLTNGSCNPAPMGVIPPASSMPSVKFVTPVNLAVISPNTTIQITLATRNFAPGWFVNSQTNYMAAPQQLDATTGFIQGHAHIVVEALSSLQQTTPTDPTQFTSFVALNSNANANGYLSANISGGLPSGVYRVSTLLTAANHQPVFLPVAQRGVSEDIIYLTVGTSGVASLSPRLQSMIAAIAVVFLYLNMTW